MPQISENFLQLVDLDPVLSEVFFNQYGQVPALKNLIFRVLTSDKAKETDLRIGSFPDPVEWSGQIEYAQFQPDYEIVYRPTKYGRGFQEDADLAADNQYQNQFSWADGMGTAFARKKEKDAWSMLNNAFISGTGNIYHGYDSQPLCSASHPRSKTDSTVVTNTSNLPLNSDNLETLIVQLEELGDDRGEVIDVMPNVVIVPRALRRVIKELVESELMPDNANNAINVHTELQYLVVPRLTSDTAWFVMDQAMARRMFKWYDRLMPMPWMSFDRDKDVIKQAAKMRYSWGWSDFRAVAGSTGTG